MYCKSFLKVSDGVCVLSFDCHTHVITQIRINNDLLFSTSYDKTACMSSLGL